MDIHDRFMKLSTNGVIVLDIITDNPESKSLMIRELVEECHKKISNGSTDLKILEIFRMILSYEYQSFVNLRNYKNPLKSNKSSYIDIRKFFVRDVDHNLNTEEFAILYDIVVLQMILKSDQQQIVKSFKDFYDTQKEHLTTTHENKNLSMKIYECFADTWLLHSYLHERENQEKDFDELRNCILTVIGSWMNQEENLEWKLLASILPKLVVTFSTKNILTPLWNKVLDNSDDLEKTLATLCVMADVSFPTEEKKVHQTHYEQSVEKKFWAILFRGLTCAIYQQRKQALYLVKRALDFIDSHNGEIEKVLKSSQSNFVPFVSKEHMEVERRNFFLILEVLEEKQKHLVLPALRLLPSLVKAYSDHKSHENCFNVVWLRCIFQRILQHDSNAVQKLALREILNADLDIYNKEFLDILANSLNNTFLYEYDRTSEKKPEIVGQLEDFFVRSEESKKPLIKLFVRSISEISWGPVAMYWTLIALVGTTERQTIIHNLWTIEELKYVKKLMEKSLTFHCRKLRNKSRILIRKAFCEYIQPNSDWSDVELIIDTLICTEDELSRQIQGKVARSFAKIIKPADAQSYVIRICDEILTNELNIELCAQTILVLLYSELIFLTNDCPAGRALHRLLANLINADCRPYADIALTLRIIDLMCRLVSGSIFQKGFHGTKLIEWCVVPYIDAILNICHKSLEKTAISTLYNIQHKYLSAIEILRHYAAACFMCSATTASWPDVTNVFKNLKTKCLNIVKNPQKFSKNQWSYVLKVMYACRDEPSFSPDHRDSKKYIPLVLKYFRNEIGKDDTTDDTESNGRLTRKFRSDCCDTIVKLINQNMYKTRDFPPPNVRWAVELHFLLVTGTEDVISPIASILRGLIDTCPTILVQDLDFVYDIIRLSWQSIFEIKSKDVFVEAIQGLTSLIVHSTFLEWDGASEVAIECVSQLMRERDSWSILKSKFVNILQYLSPEEMLYFNEALISCLLYGAVLPRDQRIERATLWHFKVSASSSDMELRSESILVLLKILKKFVGVQSEFRTNILQELLGILEKNRNKRYFNDSHVHLIKHRVMQTLLVIEPLLDTEEREMLHDGICDLLIAESNQPSVRLMQEWILVRMYAENSMMRNSLWDLFEKATEIRPGSIASIASIAFHVSRLLKGETKQEFIAQSILHLLPNCMGQQFNVRLYSQAILVKMYEMLPGNSREVHRYKVIYKGVQESLRRGNLMKNSFKVMNNFYFEIFHANNDYNLEAIYYHIPRLTGVSVDEWMGSQDSHLFWFNESDELESISQPPLKSRDALASIEAHAIESPRSTGELDEETDPLIDGGLGDIQKKIIPWKSMVPFYDELPEVSKAALSQRKMQSDDNGIIVVASLIDRPPNLGGLARTCEIFGAKEFVIGSLKYADDREFQTLSVSAEKWLTITEVKPHLLQNYLLEKQSKGWKLVGAEQTANSTNLLEMKFDKKTILLLGNEKDGIPANLIPLLDTCVEIPQNGVVRSLNVHVTGAICIWQYVKQHVLA